MAATATLLAALHCLAMNAYYEARSEPFHGQVAVAQVALRRADRDVDKVCKEVYRPAQFSWTKGRAPVPSMLDPAWQRAQRAALDAWRWSIGERVPDYSNGATHFHADWIEPPAWADPRRITTQVGRHVFYRSPK
jgi:spore germination cell wall hydrolase CwlJ-like protein